MFFKLLFLLLQFYRKIKVLLLFIVRQFTEGYEIVELWLS